MNYLLLILFQPFRLVIACVLLPFYIMERLATLYDNTKEEDRKWLNVNVVVFIATCMAVLSVALLFYTIAHQHGVNGK